MELTAGRISEIKILLEEKEWYTEDFFNLYCKFISGFQNDKEINLILKLTRDFLWIKYEDYLKYLKELLNKIYIEENYLQKKTTIIIAPLLNFLDSDNNKVKSSNFLCYIFKSHEIQNLIIFKNKKQKILENIYNFNKNEILEKIYSVNSDIYGKSIYSKKLKSLKNDILDDRLLILVDDFIGSGQTAQEAIDFYCNTCGFKKENIRILAFIIHNEGLNKIIKKGINKKYIYCIYKIKRSISEGEYSEEDLKLMEKIEKRLKIREEEKFGYGKSEALVTLIRTPNNTFPIFYKKNNSLVPLFPR